MLTRNELHSFFLFIFFLSREGGGGSQTHLQTLKCMFFSKLQQLYNIVLSDYLNTVLPKPRKRGLFNQLK